MPITSSQIQAAKMIQDGAAHDRSPQVRLVAGPGTGKSFSIEERVCWLLGKGVTATAIAVVSFTRASSVDLRSRIQAYCADHNQAGGDDVRVSTLHSLALRILRAAGLLLYPADPLVLDNWELENIFDAEFAESGKIGKRRREEIRREHEAFWNTGTWAPANYIPPDPPITDAERTAFTAFHGPRTQTYSCVLPGEIVRQCADHVLAGTLDPVALILLEHLIVDEYQDLNPVDQRFVDQLIAGRVVVFVAGDDDQSIYSFRYASPAGIETFTQRYAAAGSHTLTDCFRCTPAPVAAGNALIAAYASPNRIAKTLQSLYGAAAPPLSGTVHRWRFNTAREEAKAIADSCGGLVAAGLNPRDILILLSNQRELLPGLRKAMNDAGVPFEPPRAETFIDSDTGRFVLAMVRIVCNTDDYVAHRLILGLRSGVGTGTCNAIAVAVINNALNYRNIFYNPLPANVFKGRALNVLLPARQVCAQISGWLPEDTLGQHTAEISNVVTSSFNQAAAQAWQQYSQGLPPEMNIKELRDWLWADTDEQQMTVLEEVHERLNVQMPVAVLQPRVRVMTMHGAKGLSARVAFIPGLEDSIFPGPWRNPYPGLVLEAARLLYVSVTRARAACVISYATRRMVQGQMRNMAPSRFATSLGGAFLARSPGFQASEIQQIPAEIAQL
jgi:DNA helicase II / ATP-dependent DNA helicase PcrA